MLSGEGGGKQDDSIDMGGEGINHGDENETGE